MDERDTPVHAPALVTDEAPFEGVDPRSEATMRVAHPAPPPQSARKPQPRHGPPPLPPAATDRYAEDRRVRMALFTAGLPLPDIRGPAGEEVVLSQRDFERIKLFFHTGRLKRESVADHGDTLDPDTVAGGMLAAHGKIATQDGRIEKLESAVERVEKSAGDIARELAGFRGLFRRVGDPRVIGAALVALETTPKILHWIAAHL